MLTRRQRLLLASLTLALLGLLLGASASHADPPICTSWDINGQCVIWAGGGGGGPGGGGGGPGGGGAEAAPAEVAVEVVEVVAAPYSRSRSTGLRAGREGRAVHSPSRMTRFGQVIRMVGSTTA